MDQNESGLYKADPGAFDTYTRRVINVHNIKPSDIDINDIAHSLSLQCRYNGHCYGHLSVARHSIWVAQQLPLDLRLCGLLHDAAETYLGDLIRPLKHHSTVAVEYLKLEEIVEKAISDKFRLPYPMPQAVRDADRHVGVNLEMQLAGHRWTWRGTPAADEKYFLQLFNEYTA